MCLRLITVNVIAVKLNFPLRGKPQIDRGGRETDAVLHRRVRQQVHEIGAVVQGGQTVYTVTLNNPVWIRAYVTQPNLGNIRPGQEVLLSIDATPDKTYRGRIGFISPTAEFTPKTVETKEVRNDLVFRFRVIADDPDNVMRQGMPVTVTLRKDGGKP